MTKRILTIVLLGALAGFAFFGYKALQKDSKTTGAASANNNLLLEVHADTLQLRQNGETLVSVLYDSLKQIKPGYYTLFDSIISRTDIFNKSQLNYPNNKANELRSIVAEKSSALEFFREARFAVPSDSLPLRQLVFRMVLDSVRKASLQNKVLQINGNKEMVFAAAISDSGAATMVKESGSKYLTPLLLCGALLALGALALLFLNPANDMAKKKRSGNDEDTLRHNVYSMLGRDTPEAKYFAEVLSGYKNHQLIKEQLKPEARPDTGELIANLKKAGVLTDGESKKLYDAYELKESMEKVQAEGVTPQDKQQHLMQVLQSLTRDGELKKYLSESAGEGRMWAGAAISSEEAMPEALQKLLAYYDQRYGGGQQKMSAVYAELLRRSTLEIPEHFVAEDRFLKALHAQYRNLLTDVMYTYFDQQHNEDKVKEARQVLASRLAQLALHAHSFLTHYTRSTADLPPDAVQANMSMITNGLKVDQLPNRPVFKTYTKDITRFEREMFFQKLLSGMGVTDMENVLVRDVYFPPQSFE
jgi:hypothetical protein